MIMAIVTRDACSRLEREPESRKLKKSKIIQLFYISLKAEKICYNVLYSKRVDGILLWHSAGLMSRTTIAGWHVDHLRSAY